MSDIKYLSKALALYESIKKNSTDFFTLYYVCFDIETHNLISKLNYPEIIPITMAEFEDDDLLGVKEGRTVAEYFFTCTPSVIDYCIKRFSLEHCVYLDTDIYFYSDPKIIFQELGAKSVLITPHRFAPEYKHEEKYGKYCVQLLIFRNDASGMKVLFDWKRNCIEWCYLKIEETRYADQKYLDHWQSKYSTVVSSENIGIGLAPWNMSDYNLRFDKNILVEDPKLKVSVDLVFFHFQNLRFYKNGYLNLRSSKISRLEKELLYFPYVEHLQNIDSSIKKIDDKCNSLGVVDFPFSEKDYLKEIIYALVKNKPLNIYPVSKILKAAKALRKYA